MSKSWKILDWDYVLDTENAKIPQFTFLPTPNFITSADLNNNNLLITIDDTSCDAYNKKNVKGVVDKSTQVINEKQERYFPTRILQVLWCGRCCAGRRYRVWFAGHSIQKRR